MPKHIEALAPIQKLSRAQLLTAGEEKKKNNCHCCAHTDK